MNALTLDIRTAAAAAKKTARGVRAEAFTRRAARRTATLFTFVLRALSDWWSARREASRLSGYSDRMLKDIGVSRAGIEWVVRHGRDENPAPEPQRPIYTDKWSIENEVHPERASLMGDIRASG
jgi:uncharacterized protein YjiS (DUF1127 family)